MHGVRVVILERRNSKAGKLLLKASGMRLSTTSPHLLAHHVLVGVHPKGGRGHLLPVLGVLSAGIVGGVVLKVEPGHLECYDNGLGQKIS